MGDYFILSRISFSPRVSILSDIASMIPSLIVIALSCEVKLTKQSSNSIVFILKVLSMLHVTKVFMQFVADGSD